jgi:hypothetical protein
MAEKYERLFALKKPCDNCPFLKDGAIELHEGRLEGIIDDITNDDTKVFHCHKTVHNKRTGGDLSDDGEYTASGHESHCVGAMAYLLKIRRPNVAMRLGMALRMFDPGELSKSVGGLVINTVEKEQHEPTQEELSALQSFANKYGEHWKAYLTNAWANGFDEREKCGYLLRRVRNRLGNEWLNSDANPVVPERQ